MLLERTTMRRHKGADALVRPATVIAKENDEDNDNYNSLPDNSADQSTFVFG